MQSIIRKAIAPFVATEKRASPHESKEFGEVVSLLSEIKERLDKPREEKIVCNVEEVAAMLGRKPSTGFKIVKAPDFPAPIYQPGIIGRCWLREDVIKWAKRQRLLKHGM